MSRPAYEERPVAGPAAAWCSAAWVVRPEPGSPHRVLPDGAADLVVLPGGEVVLAGPATRPDLALPAPGDVRGLRLRPGATLALFGVPASELVDLSVPVGALPGGSTLEEAPLDALGRMRARRALDPVAVMAAAALRADPRLTIGALARRLAVSERHLRRRFADATGHGPKRFARIARLQRLLAEAGRRPAAGGAELAYAAGYADQPHMSREVTALAGVGPAALLTERGRFLQDG
jgi:AraC-like DNA-binding protein